MLPLEKTEYESSNYNINKSWEKQKKLCFTQKFSMHDVLV